MMNGWYSRDQVDQSYSNMVTKSETSEEETMPVQDNYRMRYKVLKKKFKFLVYENEFLAENLRSNQQKFLKISQDRTFLLNRLLQYEKPGVSSSESNDDTESSEDDMPMAKKKKIDLNVYNRQSMAPQQVKRKKIVQKKSLPQMVMSSQVVRQAPHNSNSSSVNVVAAPPIMTTEEVERHLQSRQSHSLLELLPERAPPTVPTEMFEPQ